MSAGAIFKIFLNDGLSERLTLIASDTSRGQNQGSKPATLQGKFIHI